MGAEIASTSSLSPRAFLKARRPERFSDSVTKEVGKLDRSVLEFQLSTLNRRNMELAFEDFAKKLCEKVICPNLLEQTVDFPQFHRHSIASLRRSFSS